MALKPQLSFSSGELDPILFDRVTLERFQNALATARNVTIGKSGTVKSRFGKFFFKNAAYENSSINIYYPPGLSVVLEFGIDPDDDPYVDMHDLSGNLIHTYTGLNLNHTSVTLQKLHFVTDKTLVYVFSGPDPLTALPLYILDTVTPYNSYAAAGNFVVPPLPVTPTYVIVHNGSGYKLDYAFTVVRDSQEGEAYFAPHDIAPNDWKKPIQNGEQNAITVTLGVTSSLNIDDINEVRFYSRPTEGSSYGFIGRTTQVYVDGSNVKAKFTDVGQNPDFTQSIPSLVSKERLSNLNDFGSHAMGTGLIYQQRLIIANIANYNEEAILASRPGFTNNFTRDYPYGADSALNFKAGSSGTAKVLRMIEKDGLVVFTTVGVFVNQGVLSPDNIVLNKRGNWVIDETIPPLVIPGGLFFVDKDTSTVRQLIFSQELGTYDSIDQSIFSDQIFREKTITSWAFQQGVIPLIIVCFSDGTFATFTYSFEHQLRAWTRHDSAYPVERVVGTDIPDTTIFIINKNGNRQIEMTIPRITPSRILSTNPEANMTALGAFMDGLKVKVDLLNDDLVGTDVFELTPVTPDDWEGELTLSCGTSDLFPNTAELGAVGTIFRFFHPKDHSFIDLEVTARTDDSNVTVQPSEEFPYQYAEDFRLYLTHLTITGLDHLEGEEVSVKCDGSMVSSPYNDNDEDDASILTVTSGSITLPERSSITVVGRPIVADVKTLNISTAEQSPTMIESLDVNKLYVRVYESVGLFVSNKFPEEEIGEVDGTSVEGMQLLFDIDIPSGTEFIANRAPQPSSKRKEVTLPGEWESNGQISLRQVDPFHFEILSIIADIEVLQRSNR